MVIVKVLFLSCGTNQLCKQNYLWEVGCGTVCSHEGEFLSSWIFLHILMIICTFEQTNTETSELMFDFTRCE